MDVTVTTAAGTSPTSTADLYAYGAPVVTGVSPSNGPGSGGTAVTITGSGFVPGEVVRFGSDIATVTGINATGSSLSVTAPAGVASVDVTVTTPAGTSATTPADLFAYDAPTVSSVSPGSGPTAGVTVVTIGGSGFVPGATVSFGANPAADVTVNSSTSITATSPAGVASVDVTVTTPAGTSATTPADQFLYGDLELTALSPSGGSTVGGTVVTITGTGFADGATVNFGGNPATDVTVNSSTSITATSPAGGAGSANVTVTVGAETSPGSPANLFAYGAPTVAGVGPDAGPSAGGTVVTVTGTGFAPGVTIDFGATAASGVTVLGGTTLLATAPAASEGPVDVTVIDSAPGTGTSPLSAADTFTYDPVPSVTSVSPNGGPAAGGTSVTVTDGVSPTMRPSISDRRPAAASPSIPPTSITVQSPAGTGDDVVVVSTPGGSSVPSVADLFAYGAPSVSTVAPNGGAVGGGTVVTVQGDGFAPGATVKFGDAAGTGVTVLSGTLLVANAPSHSAGSVDVTVATSGGTSGTSVADLFAYGPATVSSVTPDAGPAAGGTVVTVNGTGFAPGAEVNFGTNPATNVSVANGTSLTATSPAGTVGVVDVFVSTSGGASTSDAGDRFAYGPPTVTGITPHAGPTSGGTVVTVTGTSFSQDATVSFGGNPATVVTVNLAGTSLRATSPSGSASVDVAVTTPAGTSSTSPEDLFAYGTPAVTGVSPDAGPTSGGTAVTVTGTGFAPGAEVDFGTTAAGSVTVDSGTQITATSPAGSIGPVDVSVTTSQGTSPNDPGDVFIYGAPVFDSLRPVSGPTSGGTSVTITGTGFTRDATVDFGATPATSVTVTSDTSLTAVSPSGSPGVVDVTVTSPAGTSAPGSADQFAYSDQLELSCSPPPYTSPGSTCPGIDLPSVTLDGTQQSTQAPGNTIYIMETVARRAQGGP